MSTPAFYTNQHLLPQSQSPNQLSAWLSGKHPGYDLVAWCFYGNLIRKAEDQTPKIDGTPKVNGTPKIDAVAYITQFIQSPNMPQLEGIGIRPFQSGFMYNRATSDRSAASDNSASVTSDNGYFVSADMSLTPNPAVTVTSNPWSVVTSYEQAAEQSTNCISVVDGEMGAVGTTYKLSADVSCFTEEQKFSRLYSEITIVDRMGVVGVGHGPCSFSLGGLTPDQATDIKENYNDSVAEYLHKTNHRMTNQGSYYYSAPLLEVKSFKIIDVGQGGDHEVISEGKDGTLWMDYVVQSFNKSDWHSTKGSTWVFFAIQFPEKLAALETSIVVKTPDPSDPSKPTKFAMAKFFRRSSTSSKMANGALIAEKEWRMNEISFTPDPDSEWTSPNSGLKYCMKYTLSFTSQTFPVTLTVKSVRDNQEVYINVPGVTNKPVAKYEGVFEVSGTVNGEDYRGYAWGEMRGTDGNDGSKCCAVL